MGFFGAYIGCHTAACTLRMQASKQKFIEDPYAKWNGMLSLLLLLLFGIWVQQAADTHTPQLWESRSLAVVAGFYVCISLDASLITQNHCQLEPQPFLANTHIHTLLLFSNDSSSNCCCQSIFLLHIYSTFMPWATDSISSWPRPACAWAANCHKTTLSHPSPELSFEMMNMRHDMPLLLLLLLLLLIDAHRWYRSATHDNNNNAFTK